MLKTLLGQVKQYRTAAVMTPVWTTLEVVMGVLIPYVTASIIDKGITTGDLGNVYRYGAVMAALAACSLLFGILSARSGAYSSSGFAANLRSAMYANIQRFSFSDIDKYSTAGLVTRMTTDVANLQGAFQMLLRISVRAPLNIITSMVMCMVIHLRLSLIFLGAMVVLSGALYLLISRTARIFQEVFRRYDALNAVVEENVTGIRAVKAFVREEHEKGKFHLAAEALYRLYVSAERLMALNGPVMNLVVYACIIAISWFGAHLVVGGDLTTGQLTSLFSYVMTMLTSLMMFSMVFVQLTMSAASGKRVAEVIDEIPDMTDPSLPDRQLPDGSIDFHHVWFSYKEGGDHALEDIDLHIRPGETVGVIGGTGSGKSTLALLIPRLYDVSEGSVAVGGRDVRSYAMDALRSEVAVVLQKSTLFSGTVLDNLRWGRADATEEECREACRIAAADAFVEAMPEGYRTVIDQGGANLSGGQRQRLCIARALLKRPKVLILDDATSAVDTATDARIRTALRDRFPDTTRIIISQRILGIRDADRIIVMDDGRVSAFDTHERLLETSPIYRDIYEMQTSGGGDFDEKGSAA